MWQKNEARKQKWDKNVTSESFPILKNISCPYKEICITFPQIQLTQTLCYKKELGKIIALCLKWQYKQVGTSFEITRLV